jgi:uncharacterized protein (DUF2141 family)
MAFISASGIASAAPTAGSAGSRAAKAGALLVLGALLPATAPAASPAAPVGSLEIDVAGMRSARGLIRICLTADPRNFPGCVDDKHAVTRSVPASQHVIRFDDLPPGNYAAALIHDENSNAKLDTLLGIPREGFGFSRNPPIGFGPPRFAAAEFALGGVAETQQVTMRYML